MCKNNKFKYFLKLIAQCYQKVKKHSVTVDICGLTYDIDEGEEFTEEVSVGPEVVILQIGVEVVEQQFLFLTFFNL